MYGKFLVEGDKPVRELFTSSFKVDAIFALPGWVPPLAAAEIPLTIVTEAELSRISTQENPHAVVAVAYIPAQEKGYAALADNLYLVLDQLNDPGNAGSIIRIADWFGITHIFLTPNSVEVYNPKVVNAAKGSLFRVNCSYVDLPLLIAANKHLPVYGTFMDGEPVYTANLQNKGFIVIGNEAKGITAATEALVNSRIAIPPFGKAESLNAAVAAGIIVSEFKRRAL